MDVVLLGEVSDLISDVNTNVANVKSVVDTVNTNVNSVKTTVGNISNYTITNNTASKTGVLSQKLSYAISLLENSTYGLNALKNASGGYYTPSSTLIATVLSSAVGNTDVTTSDKALYLGKYVPAYSGVIKVVASVKAATTFNYYIGYTSYTGMAGSQISCMSPGFETGLGLYASSGSGTVALTPSIQNAVYTFETTSVGSIITNPSGYVYANIGYSNSNTSYVSVTSYIAVKRGLPVYFYAPAHRVHVASNISASGYYHALCNSIKIYGTLNK